jgi:hypothetical protein
MVLNRGGVSHAAVRLLARHSHPPRKGRLPAFLKRLPLILYASLGMKSSRTGAGFGSLVEDGLLPGDEPEDAVRVVVDSSWDLAQRRGDSIRLSERIA